MISPKISFVCPSFNHEKHVGDFIRSVIAQTFKEWELIIIDNASSDNNVVEIKKFDDKRINLIQNPYNKGLAFSLSSGFTAARADIICVVCSDDILYPEYADYILKSFEDKSIDAVYVSHIRIDENKEVGRLFLDESITAENAFAKLFMEANDFLGCDGMAFKKSKIAPFLPLDIGMLQYVDMQIHLFLLFNGKIKMLTKPLIKYKIHDSNASLTGGASLDVRNMVETKQFMNTYLKLLGNDVQAFKRYFGATPLIKDKNITSETIPYWLGRIALSSNLLERQKWGLQTIIDFISSADNMDLLNRLYGFSYNDIMSFSNLNLPYKKEKMELNNKLKTYRKRFQALALISVALFIASAILLLK